MSKLIELITSYLSDNNLSVGLLAKEIHLSHSQLARKLDAVTGYSPSKLIRLIRLSKAKEMLLDDYISVTAIAYDCGFNDPSYFSRIFKKEFGVTPVEWRESKLA